VEKFDFHLRVRSTGVHLTLRQCDPVYIMLM